MLSTITTLLVILGVIAFKTAVVVPMREAFVKERFGRFSGVLTPGLHFLIPFVDRIAYKQEIREQVLDVSGQTCITRDNIQVYVDGIVYLKVMDARRASYGIGDYRTASVNLAQTTMRAEIGKMTLQESFSERGQLNFNIVEEIDKASDPWGIKVLRYEIRDILPSANVTHTLEKAMEAERSRRAEVTQATAEKEATIALSEGFRQEAINLSEGQRQRQINESNGKAKEIEILAIATADGLRSVAGAIDSPCGDQAVRMRIVESFVGKLGHVFDETSISVVPAELANIQAFFQGMAKTSEAMAHITPPSSVKGASR